MRKGSNMVDSQAMIDMCLECPWDECHNCLGLKNRYGEAIRFWFKWHMEYRKEDLEKIRGLRR